MQPRGLADADPNFPSFVDFLPLSPMELTERERRLARDAA